MPLRSILFSSSPLRGLGRSHPRRRSLSHDCVSVCILIYVHGFLKALPPFIACVFVFVRSSSRDCVVLQIVLVLRRRQSEGPFEEEKGFGGQK